MSVDGVSLNLQWNNCYDFTLEDDQNSSIMYTLIFPKESSTELLFGVVEVNDARNMRRLFYFKQWKSIENLFEPVQSFLVPVGAAVILRVSGSSFSNRASILDDKRLLR